MSDVNPNTPVVEPSSSEVVGGDTPLSFDELDQALSKSKDKRKPSEKKETDKVEKVEDEKPKEAKDKKPGKKEDEKELEPKKKTYKAKSKDKELDLDEDAMFTVKVDGKDIEVPVKEILGNYSGKVSWDKKFSELSNEKMKFRKENESLGKSKDLIKQIFTEKDPTLRMFKMAEMAGVSPIEFRKAYYDENIKALESYANMSDDEKKAADLEFENSYLRYQTETRDKSLASEQAQAALKKKTDELLATRAINEAEFVDYYDKLSGLADADGTIQILRQGTQVKEKLTPDLIAEVIVKDRIWDVAEDKFKELKLGWDQAQMEKTLNDLVDNAYKHGLSAADMPSVIDELWGSKKSARSIADKVKAKEEFTQPKKPMPPKAVNQEVTFFDEI